MPRATYWLGIDWDGDGDYDDAGEVVTADLRGAQVTRGFSKSVARVAMTGHGTFVLDNSAKTYSPPLDANVLPRRKVRFSMEVSSTCAPLFDGYLEDIAPTSGSRAGRYVSLECVDALALLDKHEGSIPIQEDVRADDVISEVVSEVYTPPSTDYDNGINRFPLSAERWAWEGEMTEQPVEETTASRKILQACTSDWGKFFISKSGVPTFRNRHAMPLDTSTCMTLSDADMSRLTYRKSATTVYNHAEVTCHPRSLGEAYEVLGRLSQSNAPILEASGSSAFLLYFRDPSNNSERIGGKDATTITAGTDYICTSDPEGEGTVLSGCVSAASTIYADRAEITLSNSATSPVYVQRLQLRGYAVRGRESVTMVSTSASSITEYQRSKLKINANLLNSQLDAQLLADYLVDYYESPLDEIKDVSFLANRGSGCLAKARDLELLDRVVVSEAQTGVAASGHIYRLTHRIPHPAAHEVIFSIEQPIAVSLSPFRLDSSTLDSGHVLLY